MNRGAKQVLLEIQGESDNTPKIQSNDQEWTKASQGPGKNAKPASHAKDFRNSRNSPHQNPNSKNLQIFIFRFNFSKKTRDNFVRRKLKVNSILTSLNFFNQISVIFSVAFYFWGIFGGFAEQFFP